MQKQLDWVKNYLLSIFQVLSLQKEKKNTQNLKIAKLSPSHMYEC